MNQREFNIVERIVREAAMAAPTEPMRRHVGNLVLVLRRQGETEQAGEIGRHHERMTAPFPLAPDQIAHPTRETRRKVRRDTVRYLVNRKKHPLSSEQERAAYEIVDVMEALSAGMAPQAQYDDPSLHERGKSIRSYKSAFERMTDRRFEQWKDRFIPWADEMERLPIAPGNLVRGNRYDVMISVLVEGYTLREMEFLMTLTHGSLTTVFVGSLTRYAQLAGWLTGPACAGHNQRHVKAL